MEIETIALNIKKDKQGIYFSKSESEISYPEKGNESCMQIEEDSFWFQHRNNVIAESVKKHNTNNVFFDIGGGNGFVSKKLQDDGVEVVLVEPGKTGAINASKRGIKTVICSTLEDAEFIPKKIDSVGLFDVVEHIEDDVLFLKNIYKFMKDDGFIYITVPAFNFLWSNEDTEAGHFKRYTLSDMRRLLEKSGFKTVYATYIFSILPIPVFLFRTLPSKLGFNKNPDQLEKHKKEHQPKKGILNKLLQKIWDWELSRIKSSKKIPIGGSCFVVAQKPKN